MRYMDKVWNSFLCGNLGNSLRAGNVDRCIAIVPKTILDGNGAVHGIMLTWSRSRDQRD